MNSVAYAIETLYVEQNDFAQLAVRKLIGSDSGLLLAGSDEDEVKKAFEKLSQSQSRIGEEIYQANQSAAAAGESAGEQTDPSADQGDDIVDAEVVEDDPSTGSGQAK